FGLLLSFTPCVLPMIPIVSGMVMGSGAGPRRAVALTAAYVLAMAATYAAVGVAAGLAGANLQAALQSPWLLGSFAALFLVLAASLFGAFELRLPAALANRLDRASRGREGGSIAGAAALGLLSALLVGPCMTAPLAGALLYIGQSGSALTGGVALFALGLGMGLPLMLIAVFGARILPRPGPWMERVRRVFGYVMVAMAIYMLDRFVPGPIGLMLWGAWVLSIAVGLFAWARAQPAEGHGGWPLRFAAVFAGLWSTLMLVGAAAGGDSALRPLERFGTAVAVEAPLTPDYVAAKSVADVDARIAEAGARGQWTLIDFYADWCVSCHVIEREVFGDPAVAARLAYMQVLRPDVTANDAVDRELLGHWQVPGPPTLILVGPDGRERRAQRTVGEVDAGGFLARLDAAGAP
ncbi:MAG: protein-disulfide reductase DsbD, partial [Luteimonas sp.]